MLVGPLAEELLYRGAGISLLRPYGVATAVVGTAVLFGLAHGLLLVPRGARPLRARHSAVRVRTGSIYPSLAVHVAFNAIGMIGPLFV